MDDHPYTKIDVDLIDGKLPTDAQHLKPVETFVRDFFGEKPWSGTVQITLTQAEVKEKTKQAIGQ